MIMQCTNHACGKQCSKEQAEQRVFNTGKCGYCGGDLKEVNVIDDYGFEDWIPQHTQDMIAKFWMGHSGADHWRKDQIDQGQSELAHHGPNPNGFQLPPHGATVEYFIQDWKLSKEAGKDVYECVRGRYVHRWNNMGSLIDDNGKDWTVSTCDRWVRWFADENERDSVLALLKGTK